MRSARREGSQGAQARCAAPCMRTPRERLQCPCMLALPSRSLPQPGSRTAAALLTGFCCRLNPASCMRALVSRGAGYYLLFEYTSCLCGAGLTRLDLSAQGSRRDEALTWTGAPAMV